MRQEGLEAFGRSCRGPSLVLLFLLSSAIPMQLRSQSIRMTAPITVAPGLQDRPMTEPHVGASPADPNHLLSASMISPVGEDFGDDVRPGMRCSSFLSLDGGATWTRHDFPLTECFDPWVSITEDGRAIFTALARHPALGEPQLVVFASSDGGRTWPETPTGLGTRYDHPTNVAEIGASGREPRLYVLASQNLRTEKGHRRRAVVLHTSHDGGETFDPPLQILMSNRFHNAETAAVLYDGTLAISFTTDTWRSSDEPRRGWVVLVRNGGRDPSIPLFITDACGPPPGFALSAFTADRSAGADRERLYFACNAVGGGSVVVTSSSDRGEQWSEPLSIHTAQPADADALRQVRGLAVNKNGVLGIVWVDRWGSGDEDRCYEALFSASLDGGQSFLPARRLTEGAVCIEQSTHGALMRAHPTGGDYYGLTAAADGRFHVVWAEPGQDHLLRLRAAAIEVR